MKYPKLAGSFIETGFGSTYYEYKKGAGKGCVILIHGFSIPSFIWDHNVAELSKTSFGILRYDLYGRGYSSKPHIPYTENVFVDQLDELITKLAIHPPLYLIGFSFGGIIACHFALRFAHKIKKICLIAPAAGSYLPKALKIFQIPVLGHILFSLFSKKVMQNSIKRIFLNPEEHSVFFIKWNQQMQLKGYKYALLSTYRNILNKKSDYIYKRLANHDFDVYLIWGTEDKIVPFRNSEIIRNLLGKCVFFPIEDGAHNVMYEQPNVINQILCRILDSSVVKV